MTDSSTTPSTYCYGFWLPVGRINFFTSNQLGEDSLDQITLQKLITSPWKTWDTDSSGSKLQTSVFDRTTRVLLNPSAFTRCIPIRPPHRRKHLYKDDPSDPETLLFYRSIKTGDFLDQHILNGFSGDGTAILLVDFRGYYVLITHGLTPKNGITSEDVKSQFKDCIGRMIGSLQINRSQGDALNESRSQVKQYGTNWFGQTPPTKTPTGGILTHFQLNSLFEGLFNSTFHPKIFFHHPEAIGENSTKKVEALYSLSNIIKLITGHVGLDPKLIADFAKNIARLELELTNLEFDQTDPQTPELDVIEKIGIKEIGIEEIAAQLSRDFLTTNTRQDILRQFLRGTGSVVLQRLKWWIEEGRRSLLPETISYTNYHSRLIQLESPDHPDERLSNISEAQLIGYVKLVAAKLPIMLNVRRYVHEELEALRQDQSSAPTTQVENMSIKSAPTGSLLDPLGKSWLGLADAIEENVTGLQTTINQVIAERQLHEQEQIRYEEETVAEIERRRQRIGFPGDGGQNQSFTVLALSILAAVFTTTYGISQPFSVQPWALITLLGAAGVFTLTLSVDRRRKVINRQNRYYYEFDILVDRQLTPKNAYALFQDGFQKNKPKEMWIPDELEDTIRSRDLPKYSLPRRQSYRFGQTGESEATHKIHFETDITWKRQGRSRNFFGHLNLVTLAQMQNCEVIYEVLFHRPSLSRSYVFRELRFIATYEHYLSRTELIQLKLLIVNNFINPWLEDTDRIGNAETPDLSPLFALTITEI